MARSPGDIYDPNNSVSPSTGMPNDYLSVRSNPNQFGAQIGEAEQGLGKTLQGVSDQQTNILVQQQGLANEHAVNEAEMQLAIKGGEVYNGFKSLTGLDATNNRPKAIQDYLAVNQKIRDSLGNPAAQKAYDQLATRRMSFTIQDMNGYAAQEQKKAYRDGRTNSMNLNVQSMGGFDVASNPQQFNYAVGSTVFDVNTLYTAPGYGLYQTVPAKTDPKTGKLQFDTSTDQGKLAQSDYDNYLNTVLTKGYTLATETLLNSPDGGINKASEFLKQNKDNMPITAYAQMSAKLAPAYDDMLARNMAQGAVGQVHQGYVSSLANSSLDSTSVSGMISKGNLNPYDRPVLDNKDGTFSTTSSISIGTDSGEVLIPTVVNGKRLSTTEAIAHYKSTGENFGTFKTPEDADKFAINLHNSQATDPKFVIATLIPGIRVTSTTRTPEQNAKVGGVTDSMHLSGQAADVVLPEGVTPEEFKAKLDASGIKATEFLVEKKGDPHSTGNHIHIGWRDKPIQQTAYPADYIRSNYVDIINKVRADADATGRGVAFSDKVVARTEQHLNDTIRQQELSLRSDQDNVIKAINTGNSGQPITSVFQIENGSPEVRQSYQNWLAQDPNADIKINKLIANSNGTSKTLGTQFYDNFIKVLSGKITNSQDLISSTGADDHAPLTNIGYNVLAKQLNTINTPTGHAFAQAELAFFNKAKNDLSFSGMFPGVEDAQGKVKNSLFIQNVLPKIEAGQTKGLSAGQMFDPKSPDYVGSDLPLFQRSLQDKMKDYQKSMEAPLSQDTTSFKSLDELKAAVSSGKIKRADAINYAKKQKWVQDNPPPVPNLAAE